MYSIEQEFPLKCLETLHTILSQPEQLSSATQKFTRGDDKNSRYQCKSIVGEMNWGDEQKTAFAAAYFDALFQVFDYFQQDPQTDIHLLSAAQQFFEVEYIGQILQNPGTNEPAHFRDVTENIKRLIAIEIAASFSIVTEDEVQRAEAVENSHTYSAARFFSRETTAKIGAVATGAALVASMFL